MVKVIFINRIVRNVNNLTKCLYSLSSNIPAVAEVKQSAAALKEKPKKPPFVKNLFLGVYDDDILTFPEYLDIEKHQNLENVSLQLKATLRHEDLSDNNFLSTINEMKQLGLKVGLQTSRNYGGLELSATEGARISEAVSLDPGTALILEIQNSVLKTLEKYGSKELKEKYLPKVASSEILGGYAMCEDVSGSDPASFESVAVMDSNSGCWKLNGQKRWVTNVEKSAFFIVFVRSEMGNRLSSSKELSVFLVEKNSVGISFEKEEMCGLESCEIGKINFKDVLIPEENLIGSVGEGFDIAVRNLSEPKFFIVSSILGNTKDMLLKTINFVKHRKQLLLDLKESELVKEKLARISCIIYALESIIYITAGLIDQYDCDTALESVIMQVFSFEKCMEAIDICLSILGARGYDKSYEKLRTDLRGLTLSLQTLDVLKLFISLHGLQYAGSNMNEIISRVRNPFNFPSFILKKMIHNNRHIRDAPKMNLQLFMNLHPSLKGAAEQLEYCVLRLHYAVETLLSRHGSEIVNRQLELRRVSDIAIDIYTMTAVLSRASRSFCTGIRNCEQEVLLAKTFCQGAYRNCKLNVQDIVDGFIITNDLGHLKLSNSVFKFGEYFVDHPLNRNIL